MKVRGLLLGSAVLLTSTAALAEEWTSSPEPVPGDAKASCVGALEQAQSHEKAGRYLASQEELLKCINPVCGDAILSWCTRMPVCRQEAIETLDQRYLMSNVALGVGAAALGGAVLFYVLEPSEPTSLEVALQIVPTRQGAMGGARGRF